jgi:predicted TIM-barrel fold metal-dependent hydrolase
MTEYIPCFDSHFHIIEPAFPLVSNNGLLPKPFTTDHYLKQISHLNVTVKGGAVVSGSFQAFDTSYLENALQCLGPSYVGVINIKNTMSDDGILNLHQVGVRAVRFNLYRGGSDSETLLIRDASTAITKDTC